MSKTKLWSPAPNCSSYCLPPLNIIQVPQVPDLESFLSIFLLSIAKSHWLYPQTICRMQQVLPASAVNSLVWACLTWIFVRASELVSQLSHLPHRAHFQHRSQKDSLKIYMRSDHSAARYSAMAPLDHKEYNLNLWSKLTILLPPSSGPHLSSSSSLTMVASLIILKCAPEALASRPLTHYLLCLQKSFTRCPYGLFLIFILVAASKSSFKRGFPWPVYPIKHLSINSQISYSVLFFP